MESCPAAMIACPLCGQGGAACVNRVRNISIYRCGLCSMCFTDAPVRMDLTDLYSERYFQDPNAREGYGDYDALAPALARTSVRRLRRLEQILPRKMPLLDVGCGTGVFLAVASQRGWSCQGVEVSAYAAELGRTRYRLDIVTGVLTERLFPDGTSFGVITLWDVIEHLSDPVRVLDVCRRLLPPGGVLALSTGDIGSLCAKLSGRRWHLFDIPEHVLFFSRLTIRKLLEDVGFGVRSISYPGACYSVSYLLERFFKSMGGIGRPGPRSLERWLIPVNLFDIMEVYAVRTR